MRVSCFSDFFTFQSLYFTIFSFPSSIYFIVFLIENKGTLTTSCFLIIVAIFYTINRSIDIDRKSVDIRHVPHRFPIFKLQYKHVYTVLVYCVYNTSWYAIVYQLLLLDLGHVADTLLM